MLAVVGCSCGVVSEGSQSALPFRHARVFGTCCCTTHAWTLLLAAVCTNCVALQVLGLLSFWLGNFKVGGTVGMQALHTSFYVSTRICSCPRTCRASILTRCAEATDCLPTRMWLATDCCEVCPAVSTSVLQAVGLCLNRGPIAGDNWNLVQVLLLYIGPMYPRQGTHLQLLPLVAGSTQQTHSQPPADRQPAAAGCCWQSSWSLPRGLQPTVAVEAVAKVF